MGWRVSLRLWPSVLMDKNVSRDQTSPKEKEKKTRRKERKEQTEDGEERPCGVVMLDAGWSGCTGG